MITVKLMDGRQALFPDDTSDEKIRKVLDEDFPLRGEDVAKALRDPTFEPTLEQYQLFEQYAKEKKTDWLSAFGAGLGAMGELIGRGSLAAIEGAALNPANYIEGFAQGTRNLYGTLFESQNPASPLFQFKNYIAGDGNLEGRFEQFKKARVFNRESHELATGKSGIAIRPELTNPDFVGAVSLVADPTLILPGVGEFMGLGKLAVKGMGRGVIETGSLAGRTAERTAETLGRARELIGAGAESLAPLTTPKTAAAVIGLPAAAAEDIARSAALGGEMTSGIGESMALGPSRLGAFEQIAVNPEASAMARSLATGLSGAGANALLPVIGAGARGVALGAGIGAGLGYLSGGEEQAAQQMGAGLVLGGLGGALSHLVRQTSGGIFREALEADARRFIVARPDFMPFARAYSNLADIKSKANLIDSVAKAEIEGIPVTFHNETDRPPGAPLADYSGVTINRQAGQPTQIFINADRISPETAPHELFHALVDSELGASFASELRRILLGPADEKGEVLAPGAINRDQLSGFADTYRKQLRKIDPRRADEFDNDFAKAFSDVIPSTERTAALDKLLGEFGAFYAPVWLRAQRPNAMLQGRLPTLLEKVMSLARERLNNQLYREATSAGFDFSKGLDAGFYSGNKRIVVPELDNLLRQLFVGPKRESARKSVIDFAAVPTAQREGVIRAFGLESSVARDPLGAFAGVKSAEELKADLLNHAGDALRALENIPVADRVSTIATVKGNAQEVISNNFSASEAQALSSLSSLNPRQRALMTALLDNFRRPEGASVHTMGYFKVYGETKGGKKKAGVFEHTTRDVLPYQLKINSKGGIFFRAIDITKVRDRFNAAWHKLEYHGIYPDKQSAWKDFTGKYLANLSQTDAIPSEIVLGGGELGKRRRNFFYETLGTVPAKETRLANLPREGYIARQGKVFESFRIERVTHFDPLKERILFREQPTYQRAQVNFLPDQTIGLAQTWKNAKGETILRRAQGKFRLYRADGSLKGVFDTFAETQKQR